MKKLVALLFAFLAMGTLMAGDSDLKKAIEGDHRPAERKARDQSRHPMETLAFFGIRKDMTVVEISPGGGWFTDILAPYLNGKGKYIAASYPKEPKGKYAEYFKKAYKRYMDYLEKNKAHFGDVKVTEFSPSDGLLDIAPEGSADMVLTFRNVHNWMPGGEEAAFKSFYKALKSGGVLGVVEHRGKKGSDQDPKAESGYVTEAYVIAIAEKAGFKLAERSEVNANAKDTKDHPQGVWTLPPTLALKEKDQDKYKAIGESDRMTLKFVKP